jgi:hypothetical protein
MSERVQRVLLWWALASGLIFFAASAFLCHMIPPPHADQSAQEIAAFYQEHAADIRVGALVAGWTSGFMLPFSVVMYVQARRLEIGAPVWSTVLLVSGVMMSLFFVLPPIFWGVAAFTPYRSPEVTAGIHQLAMLTLVTTDQYYIFGWVAIVVLCLRATSVPHSPYPRWMAYFTCWTILAFELGVFGFVTRTGPFAWHGLLVFWSPLVLFGAWLLTMFVILLRCLKEQELSPELPSSLPRTVATSDS